MKRIVLYTIILLGLLMAPADPVSIDHLLPARVMGIYREGTLFVLATDVGTKGLGETPAQALENMRETANGLLYLDTVEYLLIGEESVEAIEVLKKELKGTVRLCEIPKPVDLETAAIYLQTHGGLPALDQWKIGDKLPILGVFDNRFIFLKKVENSA